MKMEDLCQVMGKTKEQIQEMFEKEEVIELKLNE